MSDTRRVEFDTKSSESVMRALADTAGMEAPERAAFWLDALTAANHRGRHDTWTAARDRAAEDAGVKLSVAKRIWQRLDTLNDVGGTPLLKLMLAYEAMCVSIEASTNNMRETRLNLKAQRNADAQGPARVGQGKSAALD